MRRNVVFIILLFILSGPAFAGVDVQFESQADFARYKTFAFQQGTPAQDPQIEKEIHDSIIKNFEAQGLKYKKTGPADLNVITHAALVKERQSHVSFYEFDTPNSFVPWDQREVRTDVKSTIDLGTLVIEMIDSKNKDIVWRATCADNIGPDRQALVQKIDLSVKAVFGMYPPKK